MVKKLKAKKRTKIATERYEKDEFLIGLAFALGALLLGALLIIAPNTSLTVLSLMLGVVLLVRALSGIYRYIRSNSVSFRAKLNLSFNLFLLLVALLCLFKVNFISGVVSYLVAFWLLIEAFNRLRLVHQSQISKRGVIDRIFALVLLGLSLILLSFPRLLGVSVVVLIGLAVFALGANSLMALFFERQSK